VATKTPQANLSSVGLLMVDATRVGLADTVTITVKIRRYLEKFNILLLCVGYANTWFNIFNYFSWGRVS